MAGFRFGDGCRPLGQHILENLGDFDGSGVGVENDFIVFGPVVLVVRLIEQRKGFGVINHPVQHLFGVGDLSFKWVVDGGVFGGDDAAQLVEDAQLPRPHRFDGVGVGQRPGLVHQKGAGQPPVQPGIGVVQRNVVVLVQHTEDVVAADAEDPLRPQRRRRLDNFSNAVAHLAGKGAVRCDRVELGEGRLGQQKQQEQHRDSVGLKIFSGDFQDSVFIAPLFRLVPPDGAEHCRPKQPLVPDRCIVQGFTGRQAFRQLHQRKQRRHLFQPLQTDTKPAVIAFGDVLILGALNPHIIGRSCLSLDRLAGVLVGAAPADLLRHSFHFLIPSLFCHSRSCGLIAE